MHVYSISDSGEALSECNPFRIKTVRKQFADGGLHVNLVGHSQVNLPVQSELCQSLAARAARAHEPLPHLCTDGDCPELPVTLGDGTANGGPFGANRQSIRNILDVTPFNDLSRVRQKGCSYRKLAVWAVRVLAGPETGVYQLLQFRICQILFHLRCCSIIRRRPDLLHLVLCHYIQEIAKWSARAQSCGTWNKTGLRQRSHKG